MQLLTAYKNTVRIWQENTERETGTGEEWLLVNQEPGVKGPKYWTQQTMRKKQTIGAQKSNILPKR